MRVAVTGASGFVGWHLRVLAGARGDVTVVPVGRSIAGDPRALAEVLDGCDRVVHLAGVNRGSDEDVDQGNTRAADALSSALLSCERPPVVAFANSTQCGNGTPYGSSKQAALLTLQVAADKAGSVVLDVRLPNVFGEHGRPFYNSVVATFSHQLALGQVPQVVEDRPLMLMHARSAATALLDTRADDAPTQPESRSTLVSDVLARLTRFAEVYRRAEIPKLSDDLDLDLFNTYRSFCSPLAPAPHLPRHVDERGALVETVKVHGGTGQCFFSTSRAGVTRGQHYHLRKIERFVVLEGEAVVSLRRKFHKGVVEHRVSGQEPVAVDMPTMWVHNITNVGPGPLLTMFWANDLFDPSSPDTYPEAV